MINRPRLLASFLSASFLLPACAEPQRTVLIRSQEEPAGENCASGGSAIRAGRDANADGTLADDEIESTTYVCRPAAGRTGSKIEGSISIWNQGDIDAIAGVTEITGDLVIEADSVDMLAFPDLVTVGGSIRANGVSAVHTLAFPKLTTAVDVLLGSESNEEEPSALVAYLELPALTRLAGRMYCVVRAGVSTPELIAATDIDIEFVELEADVTWTAPKLLEVDSVSVNASGGKVSVSLPVLVTAEGIHVGEGATLSFPELAMVSVRFSIDGTGPLALPKLTYVGEQLSIRGALTSISIPLLARAGGVLVEAATVTSLSLPALVELDGSDYFAGLSVRIGGPVSLPALTASTGNLILGAGVTQLSAPLLATIEKTLSATATSLTDISLPQLTTLGTMHLSNNPTLASLSLPLVDRPTLTYSVSISNNPMLSECPLIVLEDAWQTAGWPGSFTLSGNLACP